MKMNMKKLLLTGAIATMGLAMTSTAQATDETADATAEIETPIAITEDVSMDFATIVNDPLGDTITLTAAGGISGTGASTFSGTPLAGSFSVTGTPSAPVTISFSTGDTLTGPGTAMPLGTFTTNAGGSPAFDVGGDLSFDVGADLTINAAQVGGSYAGTYTLTVEY
jgi:hypothetical protein